MEWSIDSEIKISTSKILSSADDNLKHKLLAQREEIFFDVNQNILEKSEVEDLDQYGSLYYEYIDGGFIGVLSYTMKEYPYDKRKFAYCFANTEEKHRGVKHDITLISISKEIF